MSDKIDLSELASFDKNNLQKGETNEKNPLPDQEVIEEEKAQGSSPSGAED